MSTLSYDDHQAQLLELANEAAPIVLAKYKRRRGTTELLMMIEMDVHHYIKSRTELPFMLAITLSREGFIIITVTPPDPQVPEGTTRH